MRISSSSSPSPSPSLYFSPLCTGPNTPAMAKSRAGSYKPEVEKIMGQHHVFYFTDDPDDMSEDEVCERCIYVCRNVTHSK